MVHAEIPPQKHGYSSLIQIIERRVEKQTKYLFAFIFLWNVCWHCHSRFSMTPMIVLIPIYTFSQFDKNDRNYFLTVIDIILKKKVSTRIVETEILLFTEEYLFRTILHIGLPTVIFKNTLFNLRDPLNLDHSFLPSLSIFIHYWCLKQKIVSFKCLLRLHSIIISSFFSFTLLLWFL